jgi:single-strand DNA-binding protein
MSINATVIGNVTRDAETRAAGKGTVTKWSVAVNRKVGGQESVTFVNCSWFGTRAEKVAQYITKGGKIGVSGEIYQREYNSKQYLECDVTNVDLLGGGGRGQAGAPTPSSTQQNTGFDSSDYPVESDDLPF